MPTEPQAAEPRRRRLSIPLLFTLALGALTLAGGLNAMASAPVTTTVTAIDYEYVPKIVKLSPGDTVQWLNNSAGGFNHTATDRTEMGLFDSGAIPPGDPNGWSYTFVAAGGYPYHCSIHPSALIGSVKVKMVAKPIKGTTATAFTITWASGPLPAGYVEDVQVLAPGGSYADWVTGTTDASAQFTPTVTGKYKFHARLRKLSDGSHSNWSPNRAITVS